MADPKDQYGWSDDEETLNPEAEAVLDRLTDLLEEVEAFRKSLRRKNVEKSVELRLFLNQVKAEHRSIQGVLLLDSAALEPEDNPRAQHTVRSSNEPYLSTVWRAAKSTTGITALSKTFTIVGDGEKLPDGKRGKRKKTSVTVDVVAQNGLQWIKVSTLTERRLLFEMAKAGWEEGSDSEPGNDDDDDAAAAAADDDARDFSDAGTVVAGALATSNLSIMELATALQAAALQQRIQYLHPTVHMLLPNIHPTDSTRELNAFLATLVATGVHVTCGSAATLSPPRSVDDMAADAAPVARHGRPLSDPLNLCTTMLLALVSDIANSADTPLQDRFHPAIRKQIELERARPMLPTHLWPVLAEERALVCTPTARERFDEIVKTIATDTEAARARLLLEPAKPKKGEPLAPEQRRERLQELCCHALPAGLRLPVRTLEEGVEYVHRQKPRPKDEARIEEEKEEGAEAEVQVSGTSGETTSSWSKDEARIGEGDAEAAVQAGGASGETMGEAFSRVASKLSTVNRAIFMTGWAQGWTTVTSNGTVAKLMESVVSEVGVAGERGPDVYVIPTARSLVGKAKKIEL